MDTNNFNENIKLEDFLPKESLFLCFMKDGTKQYIIAKDESDFPFPLSKILFAANLKEFEEIIDEMKFLMASDLNNGINEIDNILNKNIN